MTKSSTNGKSSEEESVTADMKVKYSNDEFEFEIECDNFEQMNILVDKFLNQNNDYCVVGTERLGPVLQGQFRAIQTPDSAVERPQSDAPGQPAAPDQKPDSKPDATSDAKPVDPATRSDSNRYDRVEKFLFMNGTSTCPEIFSGLPNEFASIEACRQYLAKVVRQNGRSIEKIGRGYYKIRENAKSELRSRIAAANVAADVAANENEAASEAAEKPTTFRS